MKEKTADKVRLIGKIIFFVYLLALVYFLFFSEKMGRTDINETFVYNLEPFREIRRFWSLWQTNPGPRTFINLFGNVLVFVPIGFLLPLTRKIRPDLFSVVLWGFFTSLIIELLQLVTMVGSFDIDDLILNTSGAIIGYLLFWAVYGVYRLVTKE